MLKKPSAKGTTLCRKASTLKRPAASCEEKVAGARKVPKQPLVRYCKSWYNTGKAALRNNFSHGRQLFQFGSGQSKEALYKILDLCIQKLDEGMPESEALQFCKSKLTPVEDVS